MAIQLLCYSVEVLNIQIPGHPHEHADSGQVDPGDHLLPDHTQSQ